MTDELGMVERIVRDGLSCHGEVRRAEKEINRLIGMVISLSFGMIQIDQNQKGCQREATLQKNRRGLIVNRYWMSDFHIAALQLGVSVQTNEVRSSGITFRSLHSLHTPTTRVDRNIDF